jgi:pilus assembly protein CpaE
MVLTGGQSALYLNLPIKNTWANIAQFPIDEIDDYLVQSALLTHDSGVFALASPARPELGELITLNKATKVLSILREMNEYLVLDLPHDFSSTTLAGLDRSDVILQVLQPEIPSIRSAGLALETFRELGYNLDKVHLILNWTFPRKGVSRQDIENFLKKEISLVIPFASEKILHGINYGIPLVYSDPDSPLGEIFEDMAFRFSKVDHRKRTPAHPSNAWKRIAKRNKKRK